MALEIAASESLLVLFFLPGQQFAERLAWESRSCSTEPILCEQLLGRDLRL
jgi:hypothetical protein